MINFHFWMLHVFHDKSFKETNFKLSTDCSQNIYAQCLYSITRACVSITNTMLPPRTSNKQKCHKYYNKYKCYS